MIEFLNKIASHTNPGTLSVVSNENQQRQKKKKERKRRQIDDLHKLG